jgi:hypothetical protein
MNFQSPLTADPGIERKQARALRAGDLAIFPTRSNTPRRVATVEHHPKTVAVAFYSMSDAELQSRRSRGEDPKTREWVRLGHGTLIDVVIRENGD